MKAWQVKVYYGHYDYDDNDRWDINDTMMFDEMFTKEDITNMLFLKFNQQYRCVAVSVKEIEHEMPTYDELQKNRRKVWEYIRKQCEVVKRDEELTLLETISTMMHDIPKNN